jgi:hypothetical protein
MRLRISAPWLPMMLILLRVDIRFVNLGRQRDNKGSENESLKRDFFYWSEKSSFAEKLVDQKNSARVMYVRI